jgi:hypothetical protein
MLLSSPRSPNSTSEQNKVNGMAASSCLSLSKRLLCSVVTKPRSRMTLLIAQASPCYRSSYAQPSLMVQPLIVDAHSNCSRGRPSMK